MGGRSQPQLVFVVGGEQHWAAHEWVPVSRTEFAQIITRLKTELRGKTLTNALLLLFIHVFSFLFSHSVCAVGSWLLNYFSSVSTFCRSLVYIVLLGYYFFFSF
jgi:hypothetical protein